MSRLSLLALMAACTAEAPNDRDAYLATLSEDPTTAHESCARISEDSLAGECQMSNAVRAIAQGDAKAQQWCWDINSELWAEECWFLTTDERKLIGSDAVDACANAGRFRPDCTGHALARDLEARTLPQTVGNEADLRDALSQAVALYEAHAPDDHRARTSDALFARVLGFRFADAPFDTAQCGTASSEECAQAYRYANLDALEADTIEALCDEPVTAEALIQAGARPWVADSEQAALDAWVTACELVIARRNWRKGIRTGSPPPPVVLPLLSGRFGSKRP